MYRKIPRSVKLLKEKGSTALMETLWNGAELVSHIYDGLTLHVQNRVFPLRYGDGVDVMGQEWDNLLLLDACRYDFFSEENTIDGELRRVTSRGSHSWEFMEKNFEGRHLHDTVYVTANPHVEKLSDDIFYTIETVFEDWDKELGTVNPSNVAEAAIEAHQRYPDKRLIVHFMQPHEPWIGPTMNKIRGRVDLGGWDRYHAIEGKSSEMEGLGTWKAVEKGHISHREMRKAYRESLSIALIYVEKLIEKVDGRSVVTADHGELLGERIAPFASRRYGHPHNLVTKRHSTVPWLEVGADERREVTAEEPIGYEQVEEQTVNDRLVALGYTPV